MATLATAVSFKSFLGLPPALGMMLGLGLVGCDRPTLDKNAPFCERLELTTDHLREVFKQCPEPTNWQIYDFDRKSCDANAAAACSKADLEIWDALMECDFAVRP